MTRMTAEEYRKLYPANHSAAAKKRDCPTESEEQQALFAWAGLMESKHPELAWLVHVPNGGLRNMPEAVRFKAEGVRKGFPDIVLTVARGGYHSLAIELKRQRGGRVSPEQQGWIDWLNAQGWLAVVCKGAAEAIDCITKYLGGTP